MSMKMQGYFDDDGQFVPFDASGSVIPKNRKLTILVSDEPITKEETPTTPERQKHALERFLSAMDNIVDEPLGDDFDEFIKNNRVTISREVDL